MIYYLNKISNKMLTAYKLLPSEHPEITNKFTPLINLIQEEWDTYAIKPTTRKLHLLTEVKIKLDSMYHLIWRDNWKACYLAFKTCPPNFTEDLKKCFTGKNKNLALKLYKEAMLSMIDWLQTEFEKREEK